jgi:hypothetical protein
LLKPDAIRIRIQTKVFIVFLNPLHTQSIQAQRKAPANRELFNKEIPSFDPFWGTNFGLPGFGSGTGSTDPFESGFYPHPIQIRIRIRTLCGTLNINRENNIPG